MALTLAGLGACRPLPPAGYDDAIPAAEDAATDADLGFDVELSWDASPRIVADAASLPSLAGPCTPGEARCGGVELDTCAPAGDGWVRSACFPGTACSDGACQPIGSNLVIVFDTSGSMATAVPGRACQQPPFPACEPAKGCSRMDVSKVVFRQALTAIDPKRVAMALFHFPVRLQDTAQASCAEGYQVGTFEMSSDPGAQSVSPAASWFWQRLHEVMAVGFPRDAVEAAGRLAELDRWMDGVETIQATTLPCPGGGVACAPAAACGKGACCASGCVQPLEPELRATGGTPIGKTLFYVGEYLRHRVVVDGATCVSDASCGTPHHRCVEQRCVDPARHCRETVVVLFTDGGQASDPSDYFSPLPMAKRLGYGLACGSDVDCVGGATCQGGRCLPASPTGMRCLATGAACQPGAPEGDPLHCTLLPGAGVHCLPESVHLQTASAAAPLNNVLRAPSGLPFGVRLIVVDVSGELSVFQSFDLAMAAGGRVLTADTADPQAFLAALHTAFDLKNTKVCGNTL